MASLLLNVEFKNILGEGSRLDLETRLGENLAFGARYISGTGWPVGFGYGTALWYESFSLFSYYNNSISGEYDYITGGAGLFLYMFVFHDFELGAGLKKEFHRIDTIISKDIYAHATMDFLNPYMFLHLDTIDRSSFPRSGITVDGEAMYITSVMSAAGTDNAPSQRYFLNTWIYIPFHSRVTLSLSHFIGLIHGDDFPPVYYFSIGGMNTMRNIVFPFVGLDYMEANGTNIHAVGSGIQVEVFKNFFITPRCNFARIKDSAADVISGSINTVYGYGITAGYLGFLGPLQLTVARGSNDKFYYYFNLGFVF